MTSRSDNIYSFSDAKDSNAAATACECIFLTRTSAYLQNDSYVVVKYCLHTDIPATGCYDVFDISLDSHINLVVTLQRIVRSQQITLADVRRRVSRL
jgi:hypothetical protein